MRTLDEAIKKAEAAGTGAYIDIEVVTEKYAASDNYVSSGSMPRVIR
jgi:hypothetical protein